jgi:DNA polymerase-3 subunit gamma/tau
VLATAQIRELMGSVPNAVFERLLEAVAAGESATLMEQLNELLNAGHSPSSLARQMVRYLRNALMAKLDGEQTELLQISGDERARAARTALLFSEEELTRNLQIVLRTFDDLNYRQEQRFHLELGLLKLIHAQRLLPLEELLSGVAGGAGVRSSGSTSSARSTSPSSSATRTASATAPPKIAHATTAPVAAPTVRSPFGSSAASTSSAPSITNNTPAGESARSATAGVAEQEGEPAAPASRQVTPFPAVSSPTTVGFAETLTEGALAKAPATAPANTPNTDSIRQAVVTALAAQGHATASQLLGTGSWKLDGASLRIEVPGMGKKMLALTVNAAAEKIIRQELQNLSAPTRFLVVPGEGSVAAPAAAAAPAAGSVEEAALAHPMVQRAKEIFHAEVRSVVDLRK